jgi:hypothetical protein
VDPGKRNDKADTMGAGIRDGFDFGVFFADVGSANVAPIARQLSAVGNKRTTGQNRAGPSGWRHR